MTTTSVAPPPTSGPALVRGLSLLGVVALCVGNMVGTSIFTLPASLAKTTGPLGVLSWGLTAVGYLFVALVYAALGARYVRSGGPYVYAREAFGDFAAFQVVWSYWVSATIGNAAIVTSVVGYAVGFSTTLANSAVLQFALAQCLLWGLCALNIRGVRESGRFQIGVMALTVVPLLLVGIAALFSVEPANFRPFAPNGWGTLGAGAALVVWAYSGVESATVPAEEVIDGGRTVQRGTMIGYAIATVIFFVLAVAVTGALPNAEIAASTRPIALAAERTVGAWAGVVVGIAAIVSSTGTLNGWILMAGRIPLSAAADGLFFPALARIHPRYGTPWVGLLVATAIASVLLGLYFLKSLLEVFNFIVLLAVLTTLVPHLYAAAAEWAIARREGRRTPLAAPLAFVFVLYVMYGTGADVVRWGLMAVLAGLPVYVMLRGERAAGA
ncbi:MAG: amino acid permease [Gemmatimonadaceae bacterium]|jgi:APA family basic amino acid/polyamine antiporter|nr:amino acid permease [Gemmatimonadaceae bacterium]